MSGPSEGPRGVRWALDLQDRGFELQVTPLPFADDAIRDQVRSAALTGLVLVPLGVAALTSALGGVIAAGGTMLVVTLLMRALGERGERSPVVEVRLDGATLTWCGARVDLGRVSAVRVDGTSVQPILSDGDLPALDLPEVAAAQSLAEVLGRRVEAYGSPADVPDPLRRTLDHRERA